MKPFIFAALVIAVPTAAFADNAESQMNQAGIDAVEKHWGDAFTGGDAAYLGALLDDDYISVSGEGVARTKADIIALAQQIAAKNKAAPPVPASSSTPAPHVDSNTTIHGTTAIVTATGFGQKSVDVFHYENGAWHAWYSQHTMIAPPDAKS
jgi:hypothetical protein